MFINAYIRTLWKLATHYFDGTFNKLFGAQNWSPLFLRSVITIVIIITRASRVSPLKSHNSIVNKMIPQHAGLQLVCEQVVINTVDLLLFHEAAAIARYLYSPTRHVAKRNFKQLLSNHSHILIKQITKQRPSCVCTCNLGWVFKRRLALKFK